MSTSRPSKEFPRFGRPRNTGAGRDSNRCVGTFDLDRSMAASSLFPLSVNVVFQQH